MKAMKAALLAALLSGTSALADTTVTLTGHGGDNVGVMTGLLNEVVNPALKAKGISAVYQPLEGEYNDQILNALSAGTAADMFYVDIFTVPAVYGTGRVTALDDPDFRKIAGEMVLSLVEGFTYQGKLYGLPKDFNTLAVTYDKDAFDDAGVPYPDASDTWDTFADKLRQVSEKLGDTKGACAAPEYARFAAFLLGTGWTPFNDQGHTDLDDNFRRAFAYYVDLVKSGAAVTPQDVGQGWTGGCLGAGRAATALEGAWIGGFLKNEAPNMNYGVAPVPKDPVTGQRGNLIFTVAWSINDASPRKEEAKEVLKALTSSEAQQWVLERGLALPSRAALADNPYFKQEGKEPALNALVFAGASDGNVLPYHFRQHGGQWLQIVNDAISQALTGQTNVDQAISDAQAKLDKLTGRS